MKILPVFLRNNIENEFHITNSDQRKLVIEQLVCKDPKTFDISRCTIYVNDVAVNFIKSDWTNPEIFHVNGIQKKVATFTIEPFSVVKLILKVNCLQQEEKDLKDVRFQLHVSLEPNKIGISV